jgi:DNA invertase Pin-like site-specific DNA recombinase
MKGIIYTRVSSEEQIEGTSLASQEEFCRRFCEQRGIDLVGVFREEGESAKDLSLNNRSQFLAGLEFCRREKDIAAFVVYRVDRFARNTEDHFSVRRILAGYGTALYSVTEPIGNKPAEKFIETVLAGAAEYDNALRRQRCSDGLIARMNQGIWPFKPPVGYLCAGHRKRGEKKTVPDEPHPVLFPMIQRALRGYASGELVSQAALARQLNVWGFAKAFGRPARPQTADYLVGRYLPFYAGTIVNPMTGAQTSGLHTPMITRAEAEQIRRRRMGLAPAAPAKRTRYSAAFPLRRLLRCPSCDSFLTGTNCRGQGGVYAYYYCRNAACQLRSKTIRGGALHLAFVEYLRGLSPGGDGLEHFRQRLAALLANQRNSSNEHELREARVKQLTDQRRRVCEMREDGSYDAATFRERVSSIDAELDVIRSAPNRSSYVDLDMTEVLAAATWLATHLAVLWEKLSPESRARFDKLIFPSGFRWNERDHCRTSKPGLILALLGAANMPSSDNVDLIGFSSNFVGEYFAELASFVRDVKPIMSEPA